MIVRISVFTDLGTVYSYLSESDFYVGQVPASWKDDGSPMPEFLSDLISSATQNGTLSRELLEEGLVQVLAEEEDGKTWVSKKFPMVS